MDYGSIHDGGFHAAGPLCNLAKALKIEVWELFKGEGASDEQEESMLTVSRRILPSI
jgi:hypothetical protein